ncbi:CopG family ribbon-helix-helix protein [Ramlibacter sp. WS9]|uniref:CopG family ribbon-helix-helix protein n=1 Tax=Ramlibacter sp. WS9 TaxID=1882741 RepID=UPI001142214F|nr:ribbon-helix-helix domain-containing protein [Ramlibacter sp. WS9]ROZ76111.1 ribbon-helix-helix protein, CopG family [Ramlibacter sp. WS9]
MPTVSVKLPDATKARIDRLAASKGTSPHALMVEAIETKLENEERHESFIEAGLRARDEMLASGMVYDGEEFIAYMRAKMRGEKVTKPRMKPLRNFLKNPK